MKNFTLNTIGQNKIIAFITASAKENVVADTFFSDAEMNAYLLDDGGACIIELGRQYSLTGNPVTLSLNIADFNVEEIEE